MSRHQLNSLRATLAGILLAATLGLTSTPSNAQQPSLPVPATAGAAVLVGLRPGTTLSIGQHGVSASDQAVGASVSALNVQSADAVFRSVAGSGQVRLADLASPIDLRAVYRLRLPAGANAVAALTSLRANPAVVYAEPDAIAHLITIPNDTLFAQQWGLAQIDAPAAWSVVTGSSSVAIAVIDSGLDTTHPDLAGQLWTNPGEIAGNSLDDDNDGHVDDIHGWNLLGNNADLSDNNGHGTEVAGIAAAATNNSAGVAGVCWTCKLMVVKVAQPSGVANYSDIAAGVAYAAQKGAKVINLSLGGSSDSITLRAAIASAAASAVIVGGAGNDNSNALFYPAAYPEVLAVAGTTITDTKTANSNFGSWVDVTAPGEAITTTFSGGTFGASSGTSLAAPFAAGLAGLLFSQHPTWTAAQVRAQIVHTADNIDAQNPSLAGQLGSGRIDAGSSVTSASAPVISLEAYTVNGEPNGTPDPGTQADVSLTLYNDWGSASNLQATLSGGGAHASVVSATVSYGALATYESKANGGTLRINIASAAGFGASLPFTLHLTADGGYSANVPVTINTAPSVTYVHGTFNTQTWTANRVYIINNNASVAAGQTLTIQPGTVVRFAGNYTLNIAGTLIADGTALNPIQFTKLVTGSNWNSLQFLDSSVDATFDGSGHYAAGSILRHTRIDAFSGGIGLTNAGPYLAQNEIDSGGINGSGSAGLVIEGNTLAQAAMAVSLGARISNNAIVDGSITATQFDLIDGNDIQNRTGTGIVATQVLTITRNRIQHSLAGLATSEGVVTDNLLSDNAIGLSIGGSPLVLSNTVLGSSDTALDLFSGAVTVQGNNLLAAPGHYALRNDAGAGITVTVPGNWWGTTNTGAINAVIDDDQDDSNLGHVIASGFLSGPAADAPAYVQDVSIQPDSTLGIQTGTFNVSFTRPMDQSQNPEVTFYSTQRGTTTTFGPGNSGLPALAGNDMRAIVRDVDGALWFATYDYGVFRLKDNTWTTYTLGQAGMPNYPILSMAIDAGGTKWFGMDTGHIARFDGVTWTAYTIPVSNATISLVRSIATDVDGSVWVGTTCGSILHFDGAHWTVYYDTSNGNLCTDDIRAIVVGQDGTKWFGTSGGRLLKLNGSAWTTYSSANSGMPAESVRGLATDGNGGLWISTQKWLVHFDGTVWKGWTTSDAGLPNIDFGQIMAATDGSVWVAAVGSGGGLVRFDGLSWQVFAQNTEGAVLGSDADGNKWMNVLGNGVIRVQWGPDYPIAANAQWLNDHTWRATYDFTSVIPGGGYSLTVSGAAGLDGIEIAPNSATHFTVAYAGQITDQTPPSTPFVFASGVTGTPSSAKGSWQAQDNNSPIIHYRYAIGTAAGLVDVVNWTPIDSTSVTRTGLGLVSGHHYWFSVQAQNQGGLWSPVSSNEFVAGVKKIVSLYLPLLRR